MRRKSKILLVDDEADLLDGLRLGLRKQYSISIATGGADGLALFDEASHAGEPFDAVVSDMRMPHMNGAEFLTAVLARSSTTPRILLSGQADIESTIAAINDAKIYRFLTKPCSPQLLAETLDEAIEVSRLREAERELLDNTLRGTVGMLTEVLGLVSPSAYARTSRINEIVAEVCEALSVERTWNLDIAAMLSQLGCVVVSDDETSDVHRHAAIASDLLVRIPRLEGVADLIGHQSDGRPAAKAAFNDWEEHDLHREILRAAVAFESHLARGLTRTAAVDAMPEVPEPIAEALSTFRPATEAMLEATVGLSELIPGMELTRDLFSLHGTKLAGAGTRITAVLLRKLETFSASIGVAEPISVLAPVNSVPKVRLR